MSTPFINPYEVKDVAATSLNNLDKQSQGVISFLDGFFSSETVKDRQLVAENGVVETLKPFRVENNGGAFWDKGTTYYFQPTADRLREISLEVQEKLNTTDVTQGLRNGINGLFSQALTRSKSQIAPYEVYVDSLPPDLSDANADAFFQAIGTATFRMAKASSDGDASTKAISNSSELKINFDLGDAAGLLDDGDNYYNDNPSAIDGGKQPEFYLIGSNKLPVFGTFATAPDFNDAVTYPERETDPQYIKDLYNYQNKRIDPKNIYWNDTLPKQPGEVFLDMVAIAITQQNTVIPSNFTASDVNIRNLNADTTLSARLKLQKMAGEYFDTNKAWYDNPSRNPAPPPPAKAPSFLLTKSRSDPQRTIDYDDTNGLYGTFQATDTGTLKSLISAATGVVDPALTFTLANWTWNGDPFTAIGVPVPTLPDHLQNIDKITNYYTQSYLNASITSSFKSKDSAISTKNFFIHEALTNEDPQQNPYRITVSGNSVIKFNQLLTDVPSGYLRSPTDRLITDPLMTTNVSDQMMKLMDLFLEDFDIRSNRYIKDNRTVVDLFSGKLLDTPGENVEVRRTVLEDISKSATNMASQIKNSLVRGIPKDSRNQFTIDLFNQTAVTKEDYGLSPNPADPTEHFLPEYWASNKDKYLPAMYYYKPGATPPPGSPEANTTFSLTQAQNGLPAGFPIMDVRDFDQFFKGIKSALTSHIKNSLGTAGAAFINANSLGTLYNEMDTFLTGPLPATYPNLDQIGFTGTPAQDIFGTIDASPDNRTNLSRAIQLYKSLNKIIENMDSKVSTVTSDVPKIPRPKIPNTVSTIDPITNLPTTVTLVMESSNPTDPYADLPSPKLVKSFLELHKDTRNMSIYSNANLQRISYITNIFEDYSQFSQNRAYEAVYAGEVFEADKLNYTHINAKKSDPGPDGSFPEDKGIPKPLMAALASSIVVTKIGQELISKTNDVVENNDIANIKKVRRAGGNTGSIQGIDVAGSTELAGSEESQIYLKNLLNQISEASAGKLSVNISAISDVISGDIEAAINTLIGATTTDTHRMVFIDDTKLNELAALRTRLNQRLTAPVPPLTGNPLVDIPAAAAAAAAEAAAQAEFTPLKTFLNDLNPGGLKTLAYPTTPVSKAPGYLRPSTPGLTNKQKEFIDNINTGTFPNMAYNWALLFGGRPLVPVIDRSVADSFTLQEIINDANSLESTMRGGALTPDNKKLYIRKMQHFTTLFNTLSGGPDPLAGFPVPNVAPGKNLQQKIMDIVTAPAVTNSPEFDELVEEVAKFSPITKNINALEVSLADNIKRPKNGPEAKIYSSIHLFTQIEDQLDSGNYETGLRQLLNQRNIKTNTGILSLEHRPASEVNVSKGLYRYSGYQANIQYLNPSNVPSISGSNIAPSTAGEWDLRALLNTKITPDKFPPFAGSDPLVKAQAFLTGLNKVYEDMQKSKSPIIKEQLKKFDLWLKNNSFSPISDGALSGKDALEADINLLDHILEGATGGSVNDFLTASKDAALINKTKLEDLSNFRKSNTVLIQRVKDSSSLGGEAEGDAIKELKDFFTENIYFTAGNFISGLNPDLSNPPPPPPPPALPPPPAPRNPNQDYFGRPLGPNNLPVLGVNIFGTDTSVTPNVTYTPPPGTVLPADFPPMVAGDFSEAFDSFLPFEEQIMKNVVVLLDKLAAENAAETLGPPPVTRTYTKSLYRMMINNLLGDTSQTPSADLITRAQAEHTLATDVLLPSDPSLSYTGPTPSTSLTYDPATYLPNNNLARRILSRRDDIDKAINPARYDGVVPIPADALANFALSYKANQATLVRSPSIEGKSIQELAILLYIMQMFEQSNWDWEKYINDTSRYEIEAAVE